MKDEVKEISAGIIEYKGVVYYNRLPVAPQENIREELIKIKTLSLEIQKQWNYPNEIYIEQTAIIDVIDHLLEYLANRPKASQGMPSRERIIEVAYPYLKQANTCTCNAMEFAEAIADKLINGDK